jgi:LytS/YehU family sensor histidine kinase
MIRDYYLKIFCIPLLGIIIPIVSGNITYSKYTFPELLLANCYFVFISFCIWSGSQWIHRKLRPVFKINQSPFIKILSLCMISAPFGASIGVMLNMIWLRISRETFSWDNIFKFVLFTSLAVVVFTLVYEILFLSKERELDTKIVDQLDRERTQAELIILKNELDPHFIFNSLNTLSQLITTNPGKAHLFNSRLASVYKYFLINKERELIPLQDELEFIHNYMFLLQIRHDDRLSLHTDFREDAQNIKILPCALQILVENAIKHNEFTEEKPLMITISMNGEYLKVSNNTKPKINTVNSTGIGLKNLSARYRLICHKDILVESSNTDFVVKLPLIS